MKNLVSVVVAALAVVVSSSSAFADQSPVNQASAAEFCIIKDNAELTLRTMPTVQILMFIDEKYAMLAMGQKTSDNENEINFNGGWGPIVITQQGPQNVEGVSAQIRVNLDGDNVQSVVISNNKTYATAFEAEVKDLQPDPEGEKPLVEAGKGAHCYKGALTIVRGLAI